MVQLGFGLAAGVAIGYVWIRAETESKWGWTAAIVAVALGFSTAVTPFQLQAAGAQCSQPGEACAAVQSFWMIALYGSGATLLGGFIGSIGGVVAFNPERHRVNS